MIRYYIFMYSCNTLYLCRTFCESAMKPLRQMYCLVYTLYRKSQCLWNAVHSLRSFACMGLGTTDGCFLVNLILSDELLSYRVC